MVLSSLQAVRIETFKSLNGNFCRMKSCCLLAFLRLQSISFVPVALGLLVSAPSPVGKVRNPEARNAPIYRGNDQTEDLLGKTKVAGQAGNPFFKGRSS